MGIKEILFAFFLIISISIPFFFKQKELNLDKKIDLPNIEVKKGSFKELTLKLEKKGTFDKLDYINNNNNYTIYNLFMHRMDKKSNLKAKKVYFNNLYYFYKISYITDNYIYNANKAIYNPKTKIASSDYFTFFNNKIDGKGENLIYKDDIITANNIKYIIKGFK
jgi:hypothetical protein